MEPRNESVDVLRGIGMMAVVAGHAASGLGLTPFSPYSFHMPLFFFLSGLFFKEHHADTMRDVFHAARALLLPTTACILIYAIVGKLLGVTGFPQLSRPLSAGDILFSQFSTSGSYWFVAPYWFIPALFLTRLYFGLLHTRVARFLETRLAISPRVVDAVFGLSYLALCVDAVLMSRSLYTDTRMTLPLVALLHIAFAAFFYFVGYLTAKYRWQRYFAHVAVLFALYVGQQLLWTTGWVLDFQMQVMKFEHRLLPVFTSLSGIAFFYGLAQIASASSASAPLAFIGRKGMPIVLHHLFAFFLVNVALCEAGFIKPAEISNQYFLWRPERLWWLYIVAGITIPLLIDRYIAGPVSQWHAALFSRVKAKIRPA